MFIKKASKVKSTNDTINKFLQSSGYELQKGHYSYDSVIPKEKVYRPIYGEHEGYSESKFLINVGAKEDRYIIKLTILFYTGPDKETWEISNYKIIRVTDNDNKNNLSYFKDGSSSVDTLLDDLKKAISMKKEDWERVDEWYRWYYWGYK